jgi:hypothetical protein
MTSKAFPRSSLKSSKSPTKIRCPVLEIGKNSVKPSTTPKITAFNNKSRSIGKFYRLQGKAREFGKIAA